MNKEIHKYEDVKDRIVKAIDLLADPVKQTLSPRGSNVIYEDKFFQHYVTNDGVTIAKNITIDEPLERSIIDIVKSASLQTNAMAGDGTTTTILLSQSIINSGMKLIDSGWNRMMLKDELERSSQALIDRIAEMVLEVKSKDEVFNIAKISGNNDEEIAKNMVRVIDIVGNDGMVFIEPNNKPATELIEDTGFSIPAGMFSSDLMQDGAFAKAMHDVPVIVTDKRLYYSEEAETILRAAKEAGYQSVCVIARDFIGTAPNVFIANHQKGSIEVALIKHPEATEGNNTVLSDLAAYLGTKLITEKTGKLVNNLTKNDFVIAKKIYCSPQKTVITTMDEMNKERSSRVKFIREELEKEPENEDLQKRLASLTSGTVTIRVGGATPLETRERIFRYEDAVNATRAAVRDGYLVGGGLALLHAYHEEDHHPDLAPYIKQYCEASVRQIAENCGKYPSHIIETTLANKSKTHGYNAKTDTFTDLIKAGVVDPAKVTEFAIRNSFSVANLILTSRYFIVNKHEEDEE